MKRSDWKYVTVPVEVTTDVDYDVTVDDDFLYEVFDVYDKDELIVVIKEYFLDTFDENIFPGINTNTLEEEQRIINVKKIYEKLSNKEVEEICKNYKLGII